MKSSTVLVWSLCEDAEGWQDSSVATDPAWSHMPPMLYGRIIKVNPLTSPSTWLGSVGRGVPDIGH
jgi:hypothetical protein